jgi:hypothetical protein
VTPAPILSEGCRLLRVVRGTGPDRLPLKALAADLRCSIQFVALLLDGRREPGLMLAVRIEEVFNIPPRAWAHRASVQRGVETAESTAGKEQRTVSGERAAE